MCAPHVILRTSWVFGAHDGNFLKTIHGYAQKVKALANALGVMTKVRASDIELIPTVAYPLPAPRPKDSKLSSEKIKATLESTFPIGRSTWNGF